LNRYLLPHPFPARMAPEVALRALDGLPPGATIMDPMCGSGTVLRLAAQMGYRTIGFDVDPLAVLMTRVSSRGLNHKLFEQVLDALTNKLRKLDTPAPYLEWIDTDPETRAFVDFWFAPMQQEQLRYISAELVSAKGPIVDALRLSLSRVIITKEPQASLARDTSHSRPHRTIAHNDFNVLTGFQRAAGTLAKRVEPSEPSYAPRIELGDARNLFDVPAKSVAAVITSPPYLNAIDYMRGHRLSLVWLGYSLAKLRQIRASSVGTERGAHLDAKADLARLVIHEHPSATGALQKIIYRFVQDINSIMREVTRVLMPGGRAIFVIGNTTVRTLNINNSGLLRLLAENHGLTLMSEVTRELPGINRYLPPPEREESTFKTRLRAESVLWFERH